MTPEEIREKYHDDEPVVGEVGELRISPNGLRVARTVPAQFARDERRWLSTYFIDHIGLTVALLTDDEVEGWMTVWRQAPTSGS